MLDNAQLCWLFPSETTVHEARSSWMDETETLTNPTGERSGGCLCGKIRYRVTGDPRVHYCHCDMCRCATGSAFAVLAWLPVSDVSWLSEKPCFRRSSPLAKRGFCQTCGSPLTLAYDAAVNEIALHVGTFDNAAELEPRYNYGSSQRLGWVCCGIDLPHRETEEQW
ncbi:MULTISPECIES: GFA family protein [unclassified Mesorhizobium]|uniref:GFA family protein n=1 Tax=unclassified Mesorhizobium TaxID=325217 RepID=UPI00112919FE|nr:MULTISPECIES: GFA family protein [unclassified Mesorhizobium]TPL02349.1 GFA family protein [Mesorhizobium sp. B2-4-16]TPL78148.1 GFA family protein [Mesorhizobium sp. B2-4-3]